MPYLNHMLVVSQPDFIESQLRLALRGCMGWRAMLRRV